MRCTAFNQQISNNFEGFAVDTPNITTEVVDMAREFELEVAPEDVTELLASHDEPLTDEDLLDEQRKLFLEAESVVDDDDDNEIKEMSTKGLDHYVGLLHTVVKGFESIDNNFERSSKVGKRLLSDITCYTEILRERKRCSMKQTSLTSYFKPMPQIPAPSNPIIQQPSSPQQPSTLTLDSPPSKRFRFVEGSDDESH
ncbi:UNVERIFIED_CONTAM: hypothetical protein RMT77_011960 [Armadillidium vulgare]